MRNDNLIVGVLIGGVVLWLVMRAKGGQTFGAAPLADGGGVVMNEGRPVAGLTADGAPTSLLWAGPNGLTLQAGDICPTNARY